MARGLGSHVGFIRYSTQCLVVQRALDHHQLVRVLPILGMKTGCQQVIYGRAPHSLRTLLDQSLPYSH